MSPEEKELLERTYALAAENNSILKGMRRSQRMGTMMRIGYWILIIILTIAGFYFAQIYIKSLTDAMGNLGGDSGQIQEYLDLLK